ncbi:hypothetical protein AJ80_03657 [Polytolypa hystricis UAMH7299]|uniref:CNH domain-containing protein n=1 Tax=Polytolypa hystricis (strain UAMH7299) TaxID=1447883 RepID=A0A2B7YH42_POLH7|nr:hypothetical protein AJ80_03657 [Polytolypa hystricis UAMH7299]
MAYQQNQNGQQQPRYYGLPSNPAQYVQHPHAQQPHLTTQQAPLRRAPSYDAGDDRTFFEEAPPGQAGANVGYGGQGGHSAGRPGYSSGSVHSNAQNSLGSRHSQFSVGSSQHSVISQASSHGSSALSGHQHQYQPAAPTSPTQPAYNPQHFTHPAPAGHPQTGYNPQAFAPASTTQYNSQSHQQYNPAAYQSPTSSSFQTSPNLQWQSTTPGQSYGYSPQSQTQPQQHLPPPPAPVRTQDPSYSSYSPQYSASSPVPPFGYPQSLPQVQQTSPAMTSMPTSIYSSLPPPPPAQSAYNPDPYAADYSSQTPPAGRYAEPSHPPSYLPSPPPHGSVSQAPLSEPPAHTAPSDDQYVGNASRMSISSHHSSSNSVPPPPAHHNPSTSPRRTDTLSRHPQSRPLPGPPVESDEYISRPSANARNGQEEAGVNYEDLMKEVEAAVMETRPSASSRRRNSRQNRYQQAIQEAEESSSSSPNLPLSPGESQTHTNGHGHISATGTGQYVNYDAYSDDSDAEAAAGLAALQMAEEEDAAFRARRSTTASLLSAYGSQRTESTSAPAVTTPRIETSSDSDYAHHDMGLYGGGYDAHMHYGDRPSTGSGTDRIVATSGSFRSSAGDKGDNSDYDYPSIDQDNIHPFPAYTPARVDAAGTGGLSEPNANRRRLSFDDGDEATLGGSDTRPNSIGETLEGEPQDLFFHPGMSARPLPPAPVHSSSANLLPHLMPAGTYRTHDSLTPQYDQFGRQIYPASPEGFTQSNLAPSAVPRSTSLSTHTHTPRNDPLIRSKTDADKVKLKQTYESSTSSPTVTLDLPTIPAGRRKKFNPAKLSSEQFRKCAEPWALSAIVAWVRDLSEDETDLKEQAIVDAIVALFTHKVPTMNTADAETLGDRVVKNMLEEEALVKEEEWVKFGPGTLSGVLFQITGQGCYSSRLHIQETEFFGRCYSHHCMRTLKKINLHAQTMEAQKKTEDWATFYKVGKEVFEHHSKKEVDRQNILHEIVTTEDSYIAQLDVLRKLYRDQLANYQPPVIHPKRVNKFLSEVFGKVDAVKKVNEDYLLAQLKYRQKEQGPFIVGFSDIFREWIRKAKAAYIEYAATFPSANYLVRREAEQNLLFRQFLNQARENKLSQRLSWDTYLKSPITRIQRYTLLLHSVYKSMVKDSEEKANLFQAIEEIKLVAMECDNKVGEMTKKVDLRELGAKLKLRPEMKREVELNLEHLGREIIFQGDLQRPRTKRFSWVDTRAILFDHYLVLAKIVTSRDTSRTVKYETYDVSKLPIPMDLLVLESTNDDPVTKSSVKGITSVSAPVGRPPDVRGGTGNISHVGTNVSVTSTVLDNKDDKILYPFKIKHLGQGNSGKGEVYALYAPTAQNRQDWCEKIVEAKTKHAASLYAQKAEPFRLRVLSDSAFAYSDSSPASKSVVIRGTPLDRAISEVEKKYSSNLSRPLPICRASVNCATVFQQPRGKMMCAIGTDYGVFISDYDDPRGWNKVINHTNVTQLAVFEDFNLLLLIADKSLIAYHLDVICPVSGVPAQNDSQRRAPQKLSGSREVSFFGAGRMKDRALVFYKKRDGISSRFKVLEPVLQKSTTSRSRFLPRRGQTEFFRDYDEFYIPAETYGINIFHSSLAVSTQRGVEVLKLDKKLPWTVPMLTSEQPEVQTHLSRIASRVKDLKPLGMFRLSEAEFLVAFEECAVYVNKFGEVSRSVVMEFVGHAHAACLCGKFLILANEDFVEVRNAMNGRMRQVIAGRNVVLLDDGGNNASYNIDSNSGNAANSSSSLNATTSANFNQAANAMGAPAAASSGGAMGQNGVAFSSGFGTVARTVKICMQHPQYERSHIVVELVENEGQKD